MNYIKQLIGAERPKGDYSKGYMILDDGSKVPYDPSRCGVFVGKRGEPRKLTPADKSVIAYVARV